MPCEQHVDEASPDRSPMAKTTVGVISQKDAVSATLKHDGEL